MSAWIYRLAGAAALTAAGLALGAGVAHADDTPAHPRTDDHPLVDVGLHGSLLGRSSTAADHAGRPRAAVHLDLGGDSHATGSRSPSTTQSGGPSRGHHATAAARVHLGGTARTADAGRLVRRAVRTATEAATVRKPATTPRTTTHHAAAHVEARVTTGTPTVRRQLADAHTTAQVDLADPSATVCLNAAVLGSAASCGAPAGTTSGSTGGSTGGSSGAAGGSTGSTGSTGGPTENSADNQPVADADSTTQVDLTDPSAAVCLNAAVLGSAASCDAPSGTSSGSSTGSTGGSSTGSTGGGAGSSTDNPPVADADASAQVDLTDPSVGVCVNAAVLGSAAACDAGSSGSTDGVPVPVLGGLGDTLGLNPRVPAVDACATGAVLGTAGGCGTGTDQTTGPVLGVIGTGTIDPGRLQVCVDAAVLGDTSGCDGTRVADPTDPGTGDPGTGGAGGNDGTTGSNGGTTGSNGGTTGGNGGTTGSNGGNGAPSRPRGFVEDASLRLPANGSPAAPANAGSGSRAHLAMTGVSADLGFLAAVGLLLMICGGSLLRRRLWRRR